jgi:hypothetical protein
MAGVVFLEEDGGGGEGVRLPKQKRGGRWSGREPGPRDARRSPNEREIERLGSP